MRGAVRDVMAAVSATGKVTAVVSPYTSGAISKDHRSALVRFDMRGPKADAGDQVQPVLDAVARRSSGTRTCGSRSSATPVATRR